MLNVRILKNNRSVGNVIIEDPLVLVEDLLEAGDGLILAPTLVHQDNRSHVVALNVIVVGSSPGMEMKPK